MKLLSDSKKVFRVLASKYYLRKCASVGGRPRVWGKPRIQSKGAINIGERLMLVSNIVPASLVTRVNAVLDIGDRVYINYGASICAYERITIKDRVIIGSYLIMIDNDEHDLIDRSIIPPSQPITIEEDAWIGDRVTILKGVTVGRGAVIGAGSVVTRDIPADSIAAGVPARVIRTISRTESPSDKPGQP